MPAETTLSERYQLTTKAGTGISGQYIYLHLVHIVASPTNFRLRFSLQSRKRKRLNMRLISTTH